MAIKIIESVSRESFFTQWIIKKLSVRHSHANKGPKTFHYEVQVLILCVTFSS